MHPVPVTNRYESSRHARFIDLTLVRQVLYAPTVLNGGSGEAAASFAEAQAMHDGLQRKQQLDQDERRCAKQRSRKDTGFHPTHLVAADDANIYSPAGSLPQPLLSGGGSDRTGVSVDRTGVSVDRTGVSVSDTTSTSSSTTGPATDTHRFFVRVQQMPLDGPQAPRLVSVLSCLAEGWVAVRHVADECGQGRDAERCVWRWFEICATHKGKKAILSNGRGRVLMDLDRAYVAANDSYLAEYKAHLDQQYPNSRTDPTARRLRHEAFFRTPTSCLFISYVKDGSSSSSTAGAGAGGPPLPAGGPPLPAGGPPLPAGVGEVHDNEATPTTTTATATPLSNNSMPLGGPTNHYHHRGKATNGGEQYRLHRRPNGEAQMMQDVKQSRPEGNDSSSFVITSSSCGSTSTSNKSTLSLNNNNNNNTMMINPNNNNNNNMMGCEGCDPLPTAGISSPAGLCSSPPYDGHPTAASNYMKYIPVCFVRN